MRQVRLPFYIVQSLLKSQLTLQGINLKDVTLALITPKGELYFDAKKDKIPLGIKSLT
jgi:hypothetical protein